MTIERKQDPKTTCEFCRYRGIVKIIGTGETLFCMRNPPLSTIVAMHPQGIETRTFYPNPPPTSTCGEHKFSLTPLWFEAVSPPPAPIAVPGMALNS